MFRLAAIVCLLATLAACDDGASSKKPAKKFPPAPKTLGPQPLDKRFAGWEMFNGSYEGAEIPQVTLWVHSPKQLYEGIPTPQMRSNLLAEADQICKSQYATDQIAWLGQSFEELGEPERLRIFSDMNRRPRALSGASSTPMK